VAAVLSCLVLFFKLAIGVVVVWFCGLTCFSPNFNYFFFAKIECGLYFLDRFDVLMSKMIFKK
jgi:hypothetical protein